MSVPRTTAIALSILAMAGSIGLWWIGYGAGFAPFPPFDIADLMIRASPGEVATWAIANLQFNARPLAMAGGLMVALSYGVLAGLALRRFPGSRSGAAIGAVPSVLCVAVAVANDQASGVAEIVGLTVWFAITLAAPFSLAGHFVERLWLHKNDPVSTNTEWLEASGARTRRDVLIQAVGSAAAFGLGGWLLGSVLQRSGVGAVETGDNLELDEVRGDLEIDSGGSTDPPTPVPAIVSDADPDIPAGVRARNTSNEDFSVLDITTRKPALSEDSWLLKVRGLVERDIDLTYRDLLNMPSVELDGTLMCISYTFENDLISNTRWTGVPLRDVLQMAGITDGAVDVVLRGAGGYSDSVPLATALDSTTLLAYGMSGQTLPRDHGFPCRLYVPNIYGEKSVKWLEEIEIVDFDYQGYWQERGWSDDATIRTMSVIDVPNGEVARDAAGNVQAGGIAFAGSRGIQAVRIQIDGGDWLETSLEPYDPELVWQRWWYEWPAEPGEYSLRVMAVDGDGIEQDAQERDPYPDGMTGFHDVRIRVV